MELPVKALQHNHGHGSQDYFCNQLRIGKAIHGEDPIQKNQGRNLQNQLAQNREEQGNPSVSERLENADCEEIHPEKRKDQTKASQKAGSILDDCRIIHKQTNQVSGKNKVEDSDSNHNGNQSPEGKIDRLLHAGIKLSGIGVADNRHTALGKAKGHLHGNLIDPMAATASGP